VLDRLRNLSFLRLKNIVLDEYCLAHIVILLIFVVLAFLSLIILCVTNIPDFLAEKTKLNLSEVRTLFLSVFITFLTATIVDVLYTMLISKIQIRAITRGFALSRKFLEEVVKEDKKDELLQMFLDIEIGLSLASLVKRNIVDYLKDFRALTFETKEISLVFEDLRKNKRKMDLIEQINGISKETIGKSIINEEKLNDFICLIFTYESKEKIPKDAKHVARFVATDDDDVFSQEQLIEIEKIRKGEANQYTYFLPAELSELININNLNELKDKDNEKYELIKNLLADLLFEIEYVRAEDVEYSEIDVKKLDVSDNNTFTLEIVRKPKQIIKKQSDDELKYVEWKVHTLLNKNEGYFIDITTLPYRKIVYMVEYSSIGDEVIYFEPIPICPQYVRMSKTMLNEKIFKVSFDGWTFPVCALLISWTRKN